MSNLFSLPGSRFSSKNNSSFIIQDAKGIAKPDRIPMNMLLRIDAEKTLFLRWYAICFLVGFSLVLDVLIHRETGEKNGEPHMEHEML
ncbi:MAG: hypothetical protein AUG51_25885 [Acidobacteria bacterium 13_1_20CM_3_53_8]|nr:MAG: hypothetical protein AUG51_25885 [Acidobacteria bacterium 13_1_20CM_3_53_8]